MKFITCLSFLTTIASYLCLEAVASPVAEIATSNPLAGFPSVALGGRPGFGFVDTDGVLRAYLPNGTVVDAARLTAEQVQLWVNVRAPHLSEADAAKERATYAGVDSLNVPEAQLLSPPESVKPHAEIAKMTAAVEEMAEAASPANPLLEKRQIITCPALYCTSNPQICVHYGCACLAICQYL